MKKVYSKHLVCDVVLPATGATSVLTSMDVAMNALLSALERTEPEFRVVKEWNDPRRYDSSIEAELA
ncbi:uncharacterized protein BCR38DRAFT_445952 [Pseudomassariella vexata]|uniref:Uncharacterized protein n=1 Tax=Pseudomassariella vexata TaxID=1141098 RepID=A0A1Y2DJ74_9PEZI|nr:uncharacterized protein BCR38DRAFT_445952 [Pseudomassariella vexata]ORY59226.1 hypothetical protein BCR38DRAFT_445952 [Pseudomassariella vexata]